MEALLLFLLRGENGGKKCRESYSRAYFYMYLGAGSRSSANLGKDQRFTMCRYTKFGMVPLRVPAGYMATV